MKEFVLDNSVVMRWLLQSPKKSDQVYAEKVLQCLIVEKALVPNLWHLEACNVLLGAEKRSQVSVGEVEGFIAQLGNLPIRVDSLTSNSAFTRTMSLARAYKLSSYDAAYLELAVRERIPLATLDKNLIRAAKRASVEIYGLSR